MGASVQTKPTCTILAGTGGGCDQTGSQQLMGSRGTVVGRTRSPRSHGVRIQASPALWHRASHHHRPALSHRLKMRQEVVKWPLFDVSFSQGEVPK